MNEKVGRQKREDAPLQDKTRSVGQRISFAAGRQAWWFVLFCAGSMMHLDLYGAGRGYRSRQAQVVRLGGRGAATGVRSAASGWVVS